MRLLAATLLLATSCADKIDRDLPSVELRRCDDPKKWTTVMLQEQTTLEAPVSLKPRTPGLKCEISHGSLVLLHVGTPKVEELLPEFQGRCVADNGRLDFRVKMTAPGCEAAPPPVGSGNKPLMFNDPRATAPPPADDTGTIRLDGSMPVWVDVPLPDEMDAPYPDAVPTSG